MSVCEWNILGELEEMECLITGSLWGPEKEKSSILGWIHPRMYSGIGGVKQISLAKKKLLLQIPQFCRFHLSQEVSLIFLCSILSIMCI